MKTIKSLLVCGLLALTSSAFAQSVSMTFSDVEFAEGATSAELNVTFATTDITETLAGWQMTLYLPNGIEIPLVYDEDTEEDVPAIALDTENTHKKSHSATLNATKDGGSLILVSGGLKTVEMKATSGALCKITLQNDGTFTGTANVEVKGIAVAGKSGTQYNGADASFTITAGGEETGINSLNVEDSNEPAFNLAGQQVGKNYKGIVVKNGKKAIVK